MDNIISNKDNWYNLISDIEHGIIDSPFDKFGPDWDCYKVDTSKKGSQELLLRVLV